MGGRGRRSSPSGFGRRAKHTRSANDDVVPARSPDRRSKGLARACARVNRGSQRRNRLGGRYCGRVRGRRRLDQGARARGCDRHRHRRPRFRCEPVRRGADGVGNAPPDGRRGTGEHRGRSRRRARGARGGLRSKGSGARPGAAGRRSAHGPRSGGRPRRCGARSREHRASSRESLRGVERWPLLRARRGGSPARDPVAADT